MVLISLSSQTPFRSRALIKMTLLRDRTRGLTLASVSRDIQIELDKAMENKQTMARQYSWTIQPTIYRAGIPRGGVVKASVVQRDSYLVDGGTLLLGGDGFFVFHASPYDFVGLV